MTALSSKRAKRNASSHRTYVRDWSGHIVRCTMLGSEELGRLAESADDLRFYQVGPNLLPASEISRITSPLRTLAWPHRDLMTNPDQMRRVLLRQIGDRLARLRLKTGRHLLAGVTTEIEGGAERRILLLVLVPHRVESCDWQVSS